MKGATGLGQDRLGAGEEGMPLAAPIGDPLVFKTQGAEDRLVVISGGGLLLGTVEDADFHQDLHRDDEEPHLFLPDVGDHLPHTTDALVIQGRLSI